MIETPNLSFKNDDYNYLINNNELIMTCREALMENEKQTILNSTDVTLIAPSCAQTTDIQLNSVQSSGETSIMDFSKWLDQNEKILENVCYCSFDTSSSTDSACSSSTLSMTIRSDAIANHKANLSEIKSLGSRFINSIKSNGGNTVKPSLIIEEEKRWQRIYLKSYEYMMILEEYNQCPNHYTAINSSSKRSKTVASLINNSSYTGKENRITMRHRRSQTASTISIYSDKPVDKLEKDIGYSSDADQSDLCENDSSSTASQKSSNKRRKRNRKRTTYTESDHFSWDENDMHDNSFPTGKHESPEVQYNKEEQELMEWDLEAHIAQVDKDPISTTQDLIARPAKIVEDYEVEKISVQKNKEEKVLKEEKTSTHSMRYLYILCSLIVVLAVFFLPQKIHLLLPAHIDKSYPQGSPPM